TSSSALPRQGRAGRAKPRCNAAHHDDYPPRPALNRPQYFDSTKWISRRSAAYVALSTSRPNMTASTKLMNLDMQRQTVRRGRPPSVALPGDEKERGNEAYKPTGGNHVGQFGPAGETLSACSGRLRCTARCEGVPRPRNYVRTAITAVRAGRNVCARLKH